MGLIDAMRLVSDGNGQCAEGFSFNGFLVKGLKLIGAYQLSTAFAELGFAVDEVCPEDVGEVPGRRGWVWTGVLRGARSVAPALFTVRLAAVQGLDVQACIAVVARASA